MHSQDQELNPVHVSLQCGPLTLRLCQDEEAGREKFVVWDNFIRRETVLFDPFQGMQNGTLTIDVRLRIWQPSEPVWEPPAIPNLSELLDKGSVFDARFEFKGKIVKAHRSVLQVRALPLFELLEDQPLEACLLYTSPSPRD